MKQRKSKAKHCMLCKKLMLSPSSNNAWCKKLKVAVENTDLCHEC